jgi:hypothetical protein
MLEILQISLLLLLLKKKMRRITIQGFHLMKILNLLQSQCKRKI